nr:alanine racemase [Angustibacter aerolatus]
MRAACAAAGRERSDVRLIVVTKTHPAADVRRLAGLGVRDVGENRDQEAAEKAAEPGRRPRPRRRPALALRGTGAAQQGRLGRPLRGGGALGRPEPAGDGAGRRRRARRPRPRRAAAGRPGRRRAAARRPRGGVDPADLPALAERVAEAPRLHLRGLMAVAPRDEPAAPAFARLADLAAALRRDHPGATWLSAGMSGDLEEAVAAGATHLRVGTAVLGSRPPLG